MTLRSRLGVTQSHHSIDHIAYEFMAVLCIISEIKRDLGRKS